MVIYIHGFSSHGYGGKARALRAYFADKKVDFIAPSLSHMYRSWRCRHLKSLLAFVTMSGL